MAILAKDVFAKTMTPELIKASDIRAKELFDEYESLQALRKAKALTQEEVAKKLGKKQVSVAQLEKRSDFLLSTLREYVHALGGELELVVKFADHQPVVLAGIGDESLAEVPRKGHKALVAPVKRRSHLEPA